LDRSTEAISIIFFPLRQQRQKLIDDHRYPINCILIYMYFLLSIFSFNFRSMFLFFLGDRAKENECERERETEKGTDACGLCMLAVYIVVVVFSYSFLSLFLSLGSLIGESWHFSFGKKERHGSSSVWFFSINISFVIIRDSFLFILLMI